MTKNKAEVVSIQWAVGNSELSRLVEPARRRRVTGLSDAEAKAKVKADTKGLRLTENKAEVVSIQWPLFSVCSHK